MPPADRRPIDVLIVASWFPAYDNIANGRFVADQAEALLAAGRIRPAVISFDPTRLTGGAATRGRQASTVLDAARSNAQTADPLFMAPAWGVDRRLPVARLLMPEGLTPEAGVAHASIHRESVLRAVGMRLGARGDGDGRGIVHAHTVYPDGVAAVALADGLGWPLVITEHATFVARIIADPTLRQRYAAALERAHALIVVSEMLAGELRTAFPAYASRIQVVPNAVPFDRFRAAPLSERIPDQLLFVGYRKATKGIDVLLRAVAIARERRPAITLRLLGRSPDDVTEAGWKQLADDMGLGTIVTFEDLADRDEVAGAMARASVFVHASRRETFGVVAAEALASGLPVVATDSAVAEMLAPEPDRLGAVVPIDDVEAFADAIVRTLERRERFDPLALRRSVEQRFGSATVAARLLDVYRQALAAPGSPGTGRSIGDLASNSAPSRPGVVVVALDRREAALRMRPLPAALREMLILVAADRPRDIAPPEVGRVVEVAIETTWSPKPAARPGLAGRLERLRQDPIGTLRRRMGRGAGSESALRPAGRAVAATLATLAATTELLPLDGHDHLAVEPIVRGGHGRLYPGGIRRLADEWSAAGERAAGG